MIMKQLLAGTFISALIIGQASAQTAEKQNFEAAKREYAASSHDESARLRYVTKLAQIREG
jgi:hypothetical protein